MILNNLSFSKREEINDKYLKDIKIPPILFEKASKICNVDACIEVILTQKVQKNDLWKEEDF